VDHPTCPPDADTRTRDVVWAQRYILSCREAKEAARPAQARALALLRADGERRDA
jgi:hypothetical protein